MAWQNSNLADWDPPLLSSFKVNFDVVIHLIFVVAVAVFQDHSEKFMAVNTLKLPPIDALMGEAMQPYWPPDWLSQWAAPHWSLKETLSSLLWL